MTIKLNNSAGKRVIGGDTVTPRFVGKFNRSTWSVDNKTGRHLIFNVTCPQMPMCFVNTQIGQSASVRKISGSGTTWEVDIMIAFQNSISPSDITLYVFSGGYTTTTTGSFGMKIRKSGGEVSFDSGYKHANLKKAFYGVSRESATLEDWATEGISKPAFMCNLFGGGFLNYGITISRYAYLGFFGWFPTNLTACLYGWKDHITYNHTGFSITGLKTMPVPTSYSSADYVYSFTDETHQYNLDSTIFASWIDNAEFAWGVGGQYSLLDACVGDPYASPSTGFAPVGIYSSSWPGAYDVFVIDGAEYD